MSCDISSASLTNAIKDNPVTTKDVTLAEAIFGPDIGTLKGKTVNKRPDPVVDTAIEVPKELLMRIEHLPMCMDIMFVNELPFLTTLTQKLHYRSVDFIRNFRKQKYFSISRRTIDQIVQQEWFGAG